LAILIPSYGYRPDDDTISFRVSADGHYWVNAQVNGKTFRFVVDTGASGVVFANPTLDVWASLPTRSITTERSPPRTG
jgi:predicted aspartyl protease